MNVMAIVMRKKRVYSSVNDWYAVSGKVTYDSQPTASDRPSSSLRQPLIQDLSVKISQYRNEIVLLGFSCRLDTAYSDLKRESQLRSYLSRLAGEHVWGDGLDC